MKRTPILLVLIVAFMGCTRLDSYDSVKLHAGIQIPIPEYPINIGVMLDLKGKSVVEQELRQRIAKIDAYADFEAWHRGREE